MTETEKRKKINELRDKLLKVKSERDYAKAMQLALKLVLNGTYGAFCHPAFTVSNGDIANAITASSREVINWMLDHIEDYFYNHWGRDNSDDITNLGVMYISKHEDEYFIHRKDQTLIDKWGRKDDNESTGLQKLLEAYYLSSSDFVEKDTDVFIVDDKEYNIQEKVYIADFSNIKPIPNEFDVEPRPDLTSDSSVHLYRGIRTEPIVIYGDTDSCAYDSEIVTNSSTYTIEDLYNKNAPNGSAGKTLKGHESVPCDEKVLNYSKEKGLYYAPVKRIIRHKVTKQKWKLKTKSGKEIVVTNDHSMIVFRKGIQTEVKPCDILMTDKILSIK